jgi:hypothetical protein
LRDKVGEEKWQMALNIEQALERVGWHSESEWQCSKIQNDPLIAH